MLEKKKQDSKFVFRQESFEWSYNAFFEWRIAYDAQVFEPTSVKLSVVRSRCSARCGVVRFHVITAQIERTRHRDSHVILGHLLRATPVENSTQTGLLLLFERQKQIVNNDRVMRCCGQWRLIGSINWSPEFDDRSAAWELAPRRSWASEIGARSLTSNTRTGGRLPCAKEKNVSYRV